MNKYRKKPVVVSAKQWFRMGDHPKVELYARGDDRGQAHLGCIKTLESGEHGMHIVSVGDWIIEGVKGEFYACKPDIFALTYEPVSVEPEGAALDPRIVEALREVCYQPGKYPGFTSINYCRWCHYAESQPHHPDCVMALPAMNEGSST